MPVANSYVPPPTPYVGPTTKTPIDVTPGPATGTIANAPAPVNTVSNTSPITPGVATSTEPNTPPPEPSIVNLEISSVDLGLSTLNTSTGNTNIYYASVAAGNITEIQFNKGNSQFGAVSNLTFTTANGLVAVGFLRGTPGSFSLTNENPGQSAIKAQWSNYYAGNFWANTNEGLAWIDGDYNASASFVLIDNVEQVKYSETSLQRTFEPHPIVTFKPDQFLTSVRMENKPATRNVWANTTLNSTGASDANKVRAFCDDVSIRNPMPIQSGLPYGNGTVTTNPALWPSWFRLPCAEEQLEAENDQPLFPSYNPAFAYVYGALPQVQGGGLQVYHPRRDTMVHITGNTIIGVNNVYHWASNAYWVSGNGGSGPQGNLQGDLRLQGYGNGNVIISKNDYRDGWNPTNPANTWPGKYNYSNIYNYQTGVHNGEQNNLLIEYGNVVIQPVANVANNTLGIKFADGTFQYTAANGGGSSSIAVQEEGTNVVATANIINFVGSGVTASNVGGVATITVPGGTPAGNIYEVQYNSGAGTFTANNKFYYTQANGLYLGSNLNLFTTGEHYTKWRATANSASAWELGVYTSSGSEAWELYGPNHDAVLTAFPTGNILFWGGYGGEGYANGNANAGLTIGTDIRFVNLGNNAPSAGHAGIYFADGTYQYTAATGSGGGITTVQEEGTNVTTTANTINFVGSGVTASNVSGVATITITSGGISGIDILYSGSPVTANATTINFTGALANVANVGFGNATDVTIGLTVQDESNVVTGNASIGTLNFLGAGVTATAGGSGIANITIPGGTGVATVYDAGSNSTVTLDYNNGQWQNYSPNSGTLNITVSNIPTGGEMTIFLQTGGANTTVSWNGVLFWENGDKTPSTANGIRDIITIKNNGSYTFGKFSKGYAT